MSHTMSTGKAGWVLRLAVGALLAAGVAGAGIAAPPGMSASPVSTRLCADSAAVVDGVLHARCDAEFLPVPAVPAATPRATAALAPATGCGTYFVGQGQGKSPCDIAVAYSLPGPSTASASQVIGIVDAYDNPAIASELATFDSLYGLADLPTCASESQQSCFLKLNQNGGATPPAAPPTNDDWKPEISLDVESAHAVCPNCKILLVEANTSSFNNLATAVATAAAHGATVISNSYGAPESAMVQSDYNAFAGAYTRGVPVFASAGDSGWGPQFPADVPTVISVGGTSLDTSNGTRTGETVWNGTGSGCSAFAVAKSWQPMASGWSATGCGTRRSISDVSADADPSTGLIIYTEGGWWQYGGTSLSSPLIAAMYALAANNTSASAPAASAYWNPSDFFDVTSGNNGSCGGKTACAAGPGYDGPTGIGTPNGVGGFAPQDTTPSITSFAPTSGIGGTQVTITGAFIGDATAVSMGGATAAFVPLSPTQLRVTIPASASTATFSVTTPDGTAVSADPFQIVVPVVSSLVPAQAHAGATVTVNGSGFVSVQSVEFNGIAAVFSNVASDGTSLRAVVPMNGIDGDVTVRTSNGTSAQHVPFAVLPQITGMTPRNAAPGRSVSMTGSGLAGVTAVVFPGGTLASIVNQDANNLVVTVPVGARTGLITVTTPSGSAVSPGFKLIAAPARPVHTNPWPRGH